MGKIIRSIFGKYAKYVIFFLGVYLSVFAIDILRKKGLSAKEEKVKEAIGAEDSFFSSINPFD